MSGKIELFKAALGNAKYLTEVNSSPQEQLKFIATIEENQFTPQEIIESISIVKDKTVRSLLIIWLLSQKEYLTNLKGESFLDAINQNEPRTNPSRLNAWLHQLDVTVLTSELIAKLDSEAAVTLLCSIPHFHLLTEKQIQELMDKYLRPELISYWMKHFALLPNAHFVLAHFMKRVYVNVIQVLTALEPKQKDDLLTNVIEHLPLFHPLPEKLLPYFYQESCLILAAKLYLNGHFNQAYSSFIQQVLTHLLEKQHSFSLAACKLLFELSDVEEFKEISSKTSMFTNWYIRTRAEHGDTTIWYQDGHLSTPKMLQPVCIKLPPTNPEYPKQPTMPEECAWLKSIISQQKSINQFEYFLRYYKEGNVSIKKVVNDYLGYFTQTEPSEARTKAIHHLGILLLRNELCREAREALFSGFLHYPELLDEQIRNCLFFYDATKTIKYFGMQGGIANYQIIVNLCTFALDKLKPELAQNQARLKIAQEAKAEAEFELTLNQDTGFFSGIRKFIKRCLIYGWHGFFSPNLPKYMLPESASIRKPLLALDEAPKAPNTLAMKEFPILLDELEKQVLTQKKLEGLIEAFKFYSLKTPFPDELNIRLKLHNLFRKIIDHKDYNKQLYAWLMKNNEPFLNNQTRLLELYLQERPLTEAIELVKKFDTSSDVFKRVAAELNCSLPEEHKKSFEKKESHTEVPDIVVKTTDTLTGYMNDVNEFAQTTWSWVSNFGGGLFAVKPEKSTDGSEKPNGCVSPLIHS